MKKMLLVLAVVMVVLTGCNRKDNMEHDAYSYSRKSKFSFRMVSFVTFGEERHELDPIIKNKNFDRISYVFNEEVAE